MNRSDVERPLRVSLEYNPILHPLRPQMFINLVKLVEPRDKSRGHEDQPGGVRVISHLGEDGGGGEEAGEESREVRTGVDGNVCRVGGH